MKPVIVNSGGKGKSVYIKGIIAGIIAGSLCITLLLMAAAIGITASGKIPADLVNIFIYVIEGAGVFIGSYAALRIIKSGGMLWGSVTGGTMFLIILIAGLASSAESLGMNTLLKLIISLICGIAGGVMAVNKRKKVKYK